LQKIALYRKYRPETFGQMVGQEHILRVLSNAITEGKVSHAYLFTGPRGTGKTSVARILAKAINCKARNGFNPCGKCQICVGINEGKVMDLIEIDAASNRGIDEIRDLREKVKFSPTEGEYKVFIIDEVHMLTKEAFNALLKTLEEPPEHAIFVLATTEINKVPATIISRCQRHDFTRIRLTEIVAKLSEIKKKESICVSDDALELIAETSEGGMRDAISLLDQLGSIGLSDVTEVDVENILGLAPHKVVVDFMRQLISGDSKYAISILDKATSSGTDLVIFTRSSLELLRKIITVKLGSESEIEGTKEQIEEIKEIAQNTELSDLTSISDNLLWAQTTFKTNVDPKIILTLVCAKDISRTVQEPVNIDKKEDVLISGQDIKPPTTPQPQSKAQIKPNGKWQHFLLEMKAKNNTLHACLRVAVPEFIDNGTVNLIFPYKFHKEKIEEAKIKRQVEEVLTKVYETDLKVVCLLDGQGHKNQKVDDVDKAASILGGNVVE
jgi:DNA polymerase-3 subunit gamma/tau